MFDSLKDEDPLYLLRNPQEKGLDGALRAIAELETNGHRFTPALKIKIEQLRSTYEQAKVAKLCQDRIEQIRLFKQADSLQHDIAKEVADTVIGSHEDESVFDVDVARMRREKMLEPLMVDRLIHPGKYQTVMIDKKYKKPLASAVRHATKFVFDSAASRRVGELTTHAPDLILQSAEFTRVPFYRTWVEMDFGMVNVGCDLPDMGNAWLGGVLFEGDYAYFAVSAEDGSPVWAPLRVRLNGGPTPAEFLHEVRVSPKAADEFAWGTTNVPPEVKGGLLRDHRLEFIPSPGTLASAKDGKNRMWLQMLDYLSGLVPLAITAALLLIQPRMLKVIREDDGSPRRGSNIRRDNRPYMAHSVVTIRLSQERTTRRIAKALRAEYAARRRHEVRGHYCHNRDARRAGHLHEWVEYEPDRWECSVPGCNGLRWWRKAHERGDASVGFINKHYAVRPGRRR